VGRQLLRRVLRVEHETVSHEVLRSEVRLEPASPELREVGVVREAEKALEEVGEERLAEHLLVLSPAVAAQVLAEVSCAVELPVPAG